MPSTWAPKSTAKTTRHLPLTCRLETAFASVWYQLCLTGFVSLLYLLRSLVRALLRKRQLEKSPTYKFEPQKRSVIRDHTLNLMTRGQGGAAAHEKSFSVVLSTAA